MVELGMHWIHFGLFAGTNAREVMAMETIEEDDGGDAAEEEEGIEEDAAEGDEGDGDESEDEDDEGSDGAEAEDEAEEEEEQQDNAVDLDDDRTFHRDVRAVREMEDDFDREFRLVTVVNAVISATADDTDC